VEREKTEGGPGGCHVKWSRGSIAGKGGEMKEKEDGIAKFDRLTLIDSQHDPRPGEEGEKKTKRITDTKKRPEVERVVRQRFGGVQMERKKKTEKTPGHQRLK